MREEGVELLHLHCPMASALLARQLREALDLPLILTWHTKYDIDIANAIHSKLLQEGAIAALLQNVRACDEIWTVSRGAGENLRSLGFEGEYVVMENGVDLPRGTATDAEIENATTGYDLPKGVPVFLFVGRMMWYKGLRIILDALADLKRENIPFRMVFVGGGGDAREVENYAQELGLSSVCFFTGALSEREALRSWYSRADLFLFPSTFDTNGLVVREAAACDLATVMVAGSCAAEGVTDGQNGFFIEENAASMASVLRRLCAAPETIKRVGEAAGRELYLSWEAAVDRAVERYEIVLDRHRTGRYTHEHKLQDEFLRSQGELMESMGEFDAMRQELRDELRDELRAEHEDAREKIAAARADMKQRIEKGRAAFWQKMDRYL